MQRHNNPTPPLPFSLRLQALYLDRLKHLNSMCVSNIHSKDDTKKGADAIMHDVNNPHDYSHIFNEIETQMILHRALLMQRLVQDPFYTTMNISPAARMWMLRRLPTLAEHADHHYHINLMQYFEFVGREEMLKFLRYKSAPNEMIELWGKMYPANPQEAQVQVHTQNEAQPEMDENPVKRRRH